MKKSTKKTVSEDLSKNHEQRIRYRRRMQEDKEREKELKEYVDASTEIQDFIRRNNFSQ
jgi:hypothetical protein